LNEEKLAKTSSTERLTTPPDGKKKAKVEKKDKTPKVVKEDKKEDKKGKKEKGKTGEEKLETENTSGVSPLSITYRLLNKFLFTPPSNTIVLGLHPSYAVYNNTINSGETLFTDNLLSSFGKQPLQKILPPTLSPFMSYDWHKRYTLEEIVIEKSASKTNRNSLLCSSFLNLIYSVVDGSRTLHVGLRTIPAFLLTSLQGVMSDTLVLHYQWVADKVFWLYFICLFVCLIYFIFFEGCSTRMGDST
jgi:hypothetical protein